MLKRLAVKGLLSFIRKLSCVFISLEQVIYSNFNIVFLPAPCFHPYCLLHKESLFITILPSPREVLEPVCYEGSSCYFSMERKTWLVGEKWFVI